MTAQRRALASLWLIWGGCLFLIFIVQTMGENFEPAPSAAWEWFLPNIMPTITMVAGVAAWGDKAGKSTPAPSWNYYYAFGASAFYLLLLTLTLLLQPFFTSDVLGFYRQMNLGLGPLQGVAATFLGVFFVEQG